MLNLDRLLGSVDSLNARVFNNLPPYEVRSRRPSEDELALREKVRQKLPEADFVYTSHLGKQYITPAWHTWTQIPSYSKGGQYAKQAFDGSTYMASVSENDAKTITHGNLILYNERVGRFERSIASLGYDGSRHNLAQETYDLATILGEKVLRNPDGTGGRAYVRPYFLVDEIGVGVGSADTDSLYFGLYMANFPSYFKPEETKRIYEGDGLYATIFLDEQRRSPILGKVGANYAFPGNLTKRARALGDDEAIILAPHAYNTHGSEPVRVYSDQSDEALDYMAKYQHWSDGPGEGLIAVKEFPNETVVWIPPKSVNQLDSTTMAFMRNHMLPEMEYTVIEQPFGFHEIDDGLIDSVIMVGNAVGAAPVGKYRVIHPTLGQLGEPKKLKICKAAKDIRDGYRGRLKGTIPTPPFFLTPVYFDTPQANQTREMLYNAFEHYFR